MTTASAGRTGGLRLGGLELGGKPAQRCFHLPSYVERRLLTQTRTGL